MEGPLREQIHLVQLDQIVMVSSNCGSVRQGFVTRMKPFCSVY